MDRVNQVLTVFDDMFPYAECELVHSNGFELLVAVMLSAQTTDKSVNIVTKDLFASYPTPQAFVDAPRKDIEDALRRIGLYKNKAKNVQVMCQMLLDKYNGEVPSTQQDLESLPGVGRKTANVVLSVWFGVPRIAVDTHVERVSKRLKLAYNNDSITKVEAKLMRKIPRDKWSKTHHQMIFFGRYHCTARNPNCENCPLQEPCRYPHI